LPNLVCDHARPRVHGGRRSLRARPHRAMAAHPWAGEPVDGCATRRIDSRAQ
jgi:hypothetical protein